MANKHRTNEQALTALIKANDPVLNALLRERILTIGELTEKAIEESPNDFKNFLFDGPNEYLRLCENIKKVLNFEG